MLQNIKSSWSRALLLAAAIVPLAGHFGFMSVQQITKSHLVNLATTSVQWWGLLFLVWAVGILLITLVGKRTVIATGLDVEPAQVLISIRSGEMVQTC